MTRIFVDTLYWVAIFNPRDQWHARALEVEAALRGGSFLTTEAVLIEVLNYFSGYGPPARRQAAAVVRDVLNDASVETIPQTTDEFLSGLVLYESRLDKGYSLTDCISMNVLREREITDVLTHDNHFVQEGFKILL